ncbi:hypothetical protein B0A50_04002 [Salinomyces thailandicus]|uniref:HIT-type domain-containing protein n=1 Tax=Salinomyces thailandicus TaxID=706561 RepID=A0A4U0TZM5_9PEZI|nr:hypothetical protein B0A50_04002 [Salinomyces thailandica]
MASGPLRFRTPHIEELATAQSRQTPGFAWVAVSGGQGDPAKNWGTSNRKRQRTSLGGQTEQQKEALSARQQREIERKIRDLSSDNSKDARELPIPKRDGSSSGGGGAARPGKTTNTKRILASGKTFAHYLDDEEAEIIRTGRRDVDLEAPTQSAAQRPSKTPLHRRKVRENSAASVTPEPTTASSRPPPKLQTAQSSSGPEVVEVPVDSLADESLRLPTEAELEALLNAPPLTYNEARSAPPSSGAPAPRRFCETCGYWGRVRCMKCGSMVCSVTCKDDHDQFKCLKMYA